MRVWTGGTTAGGERSQSHYLVALQRQHQAVALDPSEWPPWTYAATLADLGPPAAPSA